MICTTKQSWMEQLITSCRPKPTSCTTLIIKQDPWLKPYWRTRKHWLTKSKIVLLSQSTPQKHSFEEFHWHSSYFNTAFVSSYPSPSPKLPAIFDICWAAGRSLSVSQFISSGNTNPSLTHLQFQTEYTVLFVHWLTWSTAASISAPGSIIEYILFQYLTDLKLLVTTRLPPFFLLPLPKYLFQLCKWGTFVFLGWWQQDAGLNTDGWKVVLLKKRNNKLQLTFMLS